MILISILTEKKEKRDLLEFILELSDKRRSVLLKIAWRKHNEVNEDSRLKTTALAILMEQSSASDCVYDHQYRQSSAEILDNNSIDKAEFKEVVTKVLSDGRGKGNNIMLIGPANCGKTFILSQLTEILKWFVSPTSGIFAWVGPQVE